MSLTKKEASQIISDKLDEINKLINECELIANENGVDFYFSGPSYGMGGSYCPKPKAKDGEDWEASDEDYGWNASSQGC